MRPEADRSLVQVQYYPVIAGLLYVLPGRPCSSNSMISPGRRWSIVSAGSRVGARDEPELITVKKNSSHGVKRSGCGNNSIVGRILGVLVYVQICISKS